MVDVVEVRALAPYRVWVRFSDGVAGEVDLIELAGHGVFAAWSDPTVFAQVTIDPDTHTLCWPGGVDICPRRLHDDIVNAASRAAEH
ncbi:MAG TPA: DUF2442 domain-containing protein [Polyangia bacterium]|jgi:hypothetical protein